MPVLVSSRQPQEPPFLCILKTGSLVRGCPLSATGTTDTSGPGGCSISIALFIERCSRRCVTYMPLAMKMLLIPPMAREGTMGSDLLLTMPNGLRVLALYI